MPSNQLPAGINIHPIEAFTDNYIWCLHDEHKMVVVDPGDAEPVLAFAKANNLTLAAVLITHHHRDHTGGITTLSKQNPSLPIIGPRNSTISGLTKTVVQGDSVHLPALGLSFSVLEVPGHTLDHIAFYGHGSLFCGDTLFSAGCGRLFEGSPQQMELSLRKFTRLPITTAIYCTHEYTLANLAFARAVEPTNQALADYHDWAEQQRAQNNPTLPTDLATQLAINPFLRVRQQSIIDAARTHTGQALNEPEEVFAAIRKWKDEF